MSTQEAKPVVYILQGDDTFAIEKHIQTFISGLGDPSLAEMNINQFDGAQVSLDALRSAAYSMPFLTERRLVIVRDALARFSKNKSGLEEAAETSKKGDQQKFISMLDGLPDTTALVLIIPDSRVYKQGEYRWQSMTNSHWLRKWQQKTAKRTLVVECALPAQAEMPAWMTKKARALGGEFTPEAAKTLAGMTGNETQFAAQEISKLLTYVNFKRPVEAEDVLMLTEQRQQGNIFELVDALGERNAQKAITALRILLETEEPADLFGMVVRQFRLLLLTRSALNTRQSEAGIIEKLGTAPFIARKLINQAQQFNLPMLEKIYQRLLKMDLDMKSGGTPADLAFDLLIAELAG